MKIGFFQNDLAWENLDFNLATFEEKIAALETLPDLLVLPEMFNAGFSMSYAEPVNFKTQKWVSQMAERYNITICGSWAVKETGKKYNRLHWVESGKAPLIYNKKHLFSHGSEDLHFSAGTERLITELNGFKICPLICFDLRFPVWSRNTPPHYDVLIYVASWPERRIQHWRTLLQARAIENQCYVLGVNRIGSDGNNLNYNGQSMLVGFDGQILIDAQDADTYFTAELDLTAIKKYREHFKVLGDGDGFKMM